jgi:hypothetical protein
MSPRECGRPRCPPAGGSAELDRDILRLDRYRLGRQLASWCIVSPVRPVETAAAPPERPGRSGQSWTAARLVVHRLVSAAGRDAHLAVAPSRLGRIRIDTDLDGSSPRGASSRECSRSRPRRRIGRAGQVRPRGQLASWCIISRVRPVRDAHSGGKV